MKIDLVTIGKAVVPLLLTLVTKLGGSKPEVQMRKAINYAEKYIFTQEEINRLMNVKPFTAREERKLDKLTRKLNRYKEWFFESF